MRHAPLLPCAAEDRGELLRKAEVYERAARAGKPHLAGFAAALRALASAGVRPAEESRRERLAA